jgi:hypothetical protein
VEFAVKGEAAAGNAVRPRDRQVAGEVERLASRVGSGPKQGLASFRLDEVVAGDSSAKTGIKLHFGCSI